MNVGIALMVLAAACLSGAPAPARAAEGTSVGTQTGTKLGTKIGTKDGNGRGPLQAVDRKGQPVPGDNQWVAPNLGQFSCESGIAADCSRSTVQRVDRSGRAVSDENPAIGRSAPRSDCNAYRNTTLPADCGPKKNLHPHPKAVAAGQ